MLLQIPFGEFAIFIGASDTFECFDALKFEQLNPNVDMVLFGHESDEKTAIAHGVYILNKAGILEKVWQKPSIIKLRSLNNCKNNGKEYAKRRYLTDSCYLIRSREIIQNLIETRQQFGIIDCELCAYGDFLQPLGIYPENLAESNDLNVVKWQKILRFLKIIEFNEKFYLGKYFMLKRHRF